MRINLWMIAGAAAGFVTTQPALAQQEPNPIDRSTSPEIQRDSRPPIATPPYNPQSQNPQSEARATQDQSSFARVSELIGSGIRSQDGKKLGKIEDVVTDSDARTMQFAVMGKGGFFGIGEQLLPVPWQSIKAQEGQREYVLNLDGEKLRSAPRLQGGQYTELDRPEFTTQVYEFFGVQPEGVGATSSQGELQKGQRQGQEQQGTGQLPPEQRKQLK